MISIQTAAFADLREGELRGLEWADYEADVLHVQRSVWKTFVNKPKTRASANSVPVIRQLAEILNAYRSSIDDPSQGVMFHAGVGDHMDFDKFARRTIRPAVLKIVLDGMVGMGSGVASRRICMSWVRTRKSSSASCKSARDQGSLHYGF